MCYTIHGLRLDQSDCETSQRRDAFWATTCSDPPFSGIVPIFFLEMVWIHKRFNQNEVANRHLIFSGKGKSFWRQQKEERGDITAALILHDSGTKEERKNSVENFKQGSIDLLFVFNMLLTGFDAPRLKKLYLGRVIKAHNLLQALTRVNRTYKKIDQFKNKHHFPLNSASIRRINGIIVKEYMDEYNGKAA